MSDGQESRTHAREGFSDNVRVTLLEGDADALFRIFDGLRQEMKNANRILMGLLVSISTAAILLAINILVQSAGK
jgi:hypothetical protein